jgi:formyltetrahydrofolate hydrolase
VVVAINTACGSHSGILGGVSNTVTHNCSFIIGSNLTSDKACTTFMNNVHITGSTTANGILQLSRRDTTPTGVEGMVIASGSAG